MLSDKELLERLVTFDTTSRKSNRALTEFVCDYLDRPGIDIHRIPNEDGSKLNVVAMTGNTDGLENRAGLMLCGHVDVVSADEPGWDTDPFTLAEIDSSYVARGSCDMKGFDALAINLVAEFSSSSLHWPLALLLTYDEELGSLGARRFVETWPVDQVLPSNVIIGEPTSLRAVRMHKGHLKLRITTRGRAAHSGSPQLGVNAIEPVGAIVAALTQLRRDLEEERSATSPFFSDVPHPVLNVATIRGGNAVNVIPDQCVIELGLRLLPGNDAADVTPRVRDIVASSTSGARADVDVIDENPPMLLDESSQLHRAVCELIGQSASYGVSFASDGGMLSRAGFDCVLFGPGSIEVAHRPNEFVPINEFREARRLLRSLVDQFCRDA